MPYTTRRPAEGEVNGVDFAFVKADQFQTLIEESALMDWEVKEGCFTGVARARNRKAPLKVRSSTTARMVKFNQTHPRTFALERMSPNEVRVLGCIPLALCDTHTHTHTHTHAHIDACFLLLLQYVYTLTLTHSLTLALTIRLTHTRAGAWA